MAGRHRKEENREKLLEKGLMLLSEHGYHGTGIKEILDAVQVPKGSFYNYFGSKEEFCAEIIRHYEENLSDLWDAHFAQAGGDALTGLNEVFAMVIQSYEMSGYKPGCLVGNLAAEISEVSDLCRKAMRRATDAWISRFEVLLRRAQEEGTVRTDIPAAELAGFMWSAWEGSLLRMKLERSVAPLESCIELLLKKFLKA